MRRGAEEEQTAANSARASEFASVMAGDRASRARVAAQPPEHACFAPTREDAGALEAEANGGVANGAMSRTRRVALTNFSPVIAFPFTPISKPRFLFS